MEKLIDHFLNLVKNIIVIPKNKNNPSGLKHVLIPAIINDKYIIFLFALKKNKIVVIIQMMNMDSTFPVNEFSINLGSTANSDTPNRLYLL